MRTWATEFKQFLLRGNVIDLAVAFDECLVRTIHHDVSNAVIL